LLGMHRQFKAGLPTAQLLQYYDAIRFIASQPTVVEVLEALQVAAQEDPYFEAPAVALAKGSPTAARVSDEYLRRCRDLSLRQVLDLDLRLAHAFQRGHDFNEGVRALLIDKDRQPQWAPDRLEDVSSALVKAHFDGGH
jgi:enoyl-CoA hydratase/carnithine racemase